MRKRQTEGNLVCSLCEFIHDMCRYLEWSQWGFRAKSMPLLSSLSSKCNLLEVQILPGWALSLVLHHKVRNRNEGLIDGWRFYAGSYWA